MSVVRSNFILNIQSITETKRKRQTEKEYCIERGRPWRKTGRRPDRPIRVDNDLGKTQNQKCNNWSRRKRPRNWNGPRTVEQSVGESWAS